MTKKQVMEILKNNALSGKDDSGPYTAIFKDTFNKVATEIISLYHTGQSDVVIDPKKEMLDGYNQEPIPGVTDG